MKSALELHKDILQGLQTVDAFTQDMFLPEELDLQLNRVQDSFINELLDKGFADRQLRLDYIQDLIVKNRPLDVFISPTAFYYETGAVTSFLPGNYKHLLDIRAGVRTGEDCAAIVENTIVKTKYFTYLPLATTNTDSPFFGKVELTRTETDQSTTTLATVTFPVMEIIDTYFIVRSLLYQANKKDVDVDIYWEKYADSERQGNIKQNTFIVIAPNDLEYQLVVTNGANVENVPQVAPDEQDVEIWAFEDDNDSQTEHPQTLTPIIYTSTSLLDNKEIYDRKQNVFYQPKALNPHTLLSDGILFNYYSPDFIIEKVIIDYIREPQPISLDADQGCELSLSGANIIVNRVVEYLKLAIENPIFKDVMQRNEMRDQK